MGAIAIFLAARMGLGERLAARMDAGEGMVKRIKDGIDENQWSMLFLIRLVPAVPFFVANLCRRWSGVPLLALRGHDLPRHHPGALVYHLGRRGPGRGVRPGRDARTSASSSSRRSCCRSSGSARWRRCRSCSRPCAARRASDDHETDQDGYSGDRRRLGRAVGRGGRGADGRAGRAAGRAQDGRRLPELRLRALQGADRERPRPPMRRRMPRRSASPT